MRKTRYAATELAEVYQASGARRLISVLIERGHVEPTGKGSVVFSAELEPHVFELLCVFGADLTDIEPEPIEDESLDEEHSRDLPHAQPDEPVRRHAGGRQAW